MKAFATEDAVDSSSSSIGSERIRLDDGSRRLMLYVKMTFLFSFLDFGSYHT